MKFQWELTTDTNEKSECSHLWYFSILWPFPVFLQPAHCVGRQKYSGPLDRCSIWKDLIGPPWDTTWSQSHFVGNEMFSWSSLTHIPGWSDGGSLIISFSSILQSTHCSHIKGRVKGCLFDPLWKLSFGFFFSYGLWKICNKRSTLFIALPFLLGGIP